MSTRLCHVFRVLLTLGVVPISISALHAQPAVPTAEAGATVKAPPLPVIKSPVALFRELLAMSPDDRDRELANRPPEIRKRILAKVQEYAAMKADDRDLRLRLTEQRWYLLSLVNLPPAQRADILANVPEAERPSLTDRLLQWDQLPADEQKEILQYEKSTEHFVDQNLAGHVSVSNLLATPPPPLPPGALKNLDNFLQLPPEQRQQMYASFQRFFELTDAEKQQTVGLLPDTQRQQMTTVLHSFDTLPKAARDERLKAFAKFSNMSVEERQEFMKNAERWRELSPAEREAWRSLINRLPPSPPLPPGMVFPPMPPRSALQASQDIATNATP
jgi:hypothetical protein